MPIAKWIPDLPGRPICGRVAAIACYPFLMIVCALFLAPIQARGQNLLVNGGFEGPPLPPNTSQNVDPNSWTRIGTVNGAIYHVFNGTGGESWAPVPHGGSQDFLLGLDGSGIFQNITLSQPASLRLDWWMTLSLDSFGISSIPYTVRVVDTANAVVASGQFETFANAPWANASLDFALSSGQYTIEFSSPTPYTEATSGLFLDDVHLAAVPEPGGLILFSFGGLLLLCRFASSSRRAH